jgi:hypothetical protein
MNLRCRSRGPIGTGSNIGGIARLAHKASIKVQSILLWRDRYVLNISQAETLSAQAAIIALLLASETRMGGFESYDLHLGFG